MQRLILTALWLILGLSPLPATAQATPHNHARHNMVVFGTSEIFASHIVYKAPHNYQVILRLKFEDSVKLDYLAASAAHPDDLFILLLDEMDISTIAAADSLTGDLLRRPTTGDDVVIAAHVHFEKDAFQLLYFDELPLSLERQAATAARLAKFSAASTSCSASCGPLSMANDRCSVTCPAGQRALCSRSGSGQDCAASCSCTGRDF